VTAPAPRTFGDIDDTSLPLAVLVHGFPDTPHTWRHLGPELAAHGYRAVAPWLPGYDVPVGKPISAGTYARAILAARREHRADDRAILVGHDWGAIAGYGAVAFDPAAFSRFVALAVPPTAALAEGIFGYAQLKRSFYVWFIQQVGLADGVVIGPGFFESLWADWSPGYDASEDIAELRRYVDADNIADVVAPYRASFNPDFADPDAEAEAAAGMQPPPVPTLYLHGANDGALGADLLTDVDAHLPTEGSVAEIVEGIGHFLHLEQPRLIAEKITGWLAG
jgi:pimeloyl-ACP methyl ester carboxylesterase